MTQRRLVAGLLALLLLAPTLARAEGLAGLLPAEGDAAVAAALDRQLGEALARQRQTNVLGPLEVKGRLAAAASLQQELTPVRSLLATTQRATLNMDRPAAVRAGQQLVAALQRAQARYHAPEQLAAAHSALARALLLKPEEPAAALAAYRQMLQLAPDFRPDPDRTPPRAQQLIAQAAQELVPLPPPPASELAAVAQLAGVEPLLWLAAWRQGSAVSLQLVLLREGTIAAGRQETVQPQLLPAAALALVLEALGAPKSPAPAASQPAARPDQLAAAPPSTQEQPALLVPPPGALRRPAAASSAWYKRWWVWTLAGVAVAGLVGGLAYGLRDDSSEPAGAERINLDFRWEQLP